MDLRIFTEPQQGAAYDDLLAVARATESAGFDAFFRSDHFLRMGDVDGLPGPSDAWITLAGLARETERIRLGTLVTAATFREPGILAVEVAGVDQMSGGRIELGLGTGWYEAEHTAVGVPFRTLGERFERFEEQLQIIRGMWETPAGESFSFKGRHYELTDSPGLPKPAQSPRPPIIIGGGGPKRTPRLAAEHADEFNLGFRGVDAFVVQRDRVRAACEAVDRDPATMIFSVAQVAVLGDDAATLERRATAIGREVDELRENGLAGTTSEVVAQIEAFAAAGVSRVYLQILDLADLDHVAELGEGLLPAFA
jgi:F420-dependent oxidoreductase-like protein